MSENFDVKQRTENIYKRWRYECTKKLSDKHSMQVGETLERFYKRINLDEKRRSRSSQNDRGGERRCIFLVDDKKDVMYRIRKVSSAVGLIIGFLVGLAIAYFIWISFIHPQPQGPGLLPQWTTKGGIV